MANGLSTFTQSHQYIAGGILMVIGLLGVFGSVSGNLPGMIAGLFDPSDLDLSKKGSKTPTLVNPIPSEPIIGSILTNITIFGRGPRKILTSLFHGKIPNVGTLF